MDEAALAKMKESRIEFCSDWETIRDTFDSLPVPRVDFDSEGDLIRTVWAFRGHKSVDYRLQPSIEREAEGKPTSWAALESMVLGEFQAKARLHMDVADLPRTDEKLSWLALMQHYGIPSRLLDFSYSPYIGLYFALRNRTLSERGSSAQVWAIDVDAIQERAVRISLTADEEERQHCARKAGEELKPRGVSLDPRFAASDLDVWQDDHEYRNKVVQMALAPGGIRRDHFKRHGFVAAALPPLQNSRLSSQQGVFLFNGAEDLTFEESLFTMMGGFDPVWYRIFRVPADLLPELERKLFQMNVHDLSLFPDLEGLAGFIRQKVHLLWCPADT
jgi:hypothetical protein